jgi:twitching motility protein PilT
VEVELTSRAGEIRAVVRPATPSSPFPEAPSRPAAASQSAASLHGPPAGASSSPGPVPRGPTAEVADAQAAEVQRTTALPLPVDPGEAMQVLLHEIVVRKASDMHLASGHPPAFRVDGDIQSVPGFGLLEPSRLADMLWTLAPVKNREEFQERNDTDFATATAEARFRVNVFADRHGIGAVLRQIPSKVLSATDLGLGQPILDLCFLTKGLVLVTGPTGSGKSTTLAAMIDHVNRNRDDHIITIEDPVEFVHENKRCLVNQREVGTHTQSFKAALRAALREDPDVVLVGELRDLETIAIAIETAETGHLVFGTLHTNSAPSTVDRMIDQFPTDRQAQIRTMLSESLRGVVTQVLCKKKGGGRVAAMEILLVSSSVSNLIREGKTFQIPSVMQTAKGIGMCTMNDSLLDLVKKGLVEPSEALAKAVAKNELRQLFERNDIAVPA